MSLESSAPSPRSARKGRHPTPEQDTIKTPEQDTITSSQQDTIKTVDELKEAVSASPNLEGRIKLAFVEIVDDLLNFGIPFHILVEAYERGKPSYSALIKLMPDMFKDLFLQRIATVLAEHPEITDEELALTNGEERKELIAKRDARNEINAVASVLINLKDQLLGNPTVFDLLRKFGTDQLRTMRQLATRLRHSHLKNLNEVLRREIEALEPERSTRSSGLSTNGTRLTSASSL